MKLQKKCSRIVYALMLGYWTTSVQTYAMDKVPFVSADANKGALHNAQKLFKPFLQENKNNWHKHASKMQRLEALQAEKGNTIFFLPLVPAGTQGIDALTQFLFLPRDQALTLFPGIPCTFFDYRIIAKKRVRADAKASTQDAYPENVLSAEMLAKEALMAFDVQSVEVALKEQPHDQGATRAPLEHAEVVYASKEFVPSGYNKFTYRLYFKKIQEEELRAKEKRVVETSNPISQTTALQEDGRLPKKIIPEDLENFEGRPLRKDPVENLVAQEPVITPKEFFKRVCSCLAKKFSDWSEERMNIMEKGLQEKIRKNNRNYQKELANQDKKYQKALAEQADKLAKQEEEFSKLREHMIAVQNSLNIMQNYESKLGYCLINLQQHVANHVPSQERAVLGNRDMNMQLNIQNPLLGNNEVSDVPSVSVPAEAENRAENRESILKEEGV